MSEDQQQLRGQDVPLSNGKPHPMRGQDVPLAAPKPEVRGFSGSLPRQLGAPPMPAQPAAHDFSDELARIAQELRDGQWSPRPFQSPFVAKITSIGATGSIYPWGGAFACQWQEQCFVNGAYVDFADGRKSTSYTDGTAALQRGIRFPKFTHPTPGVMYVGQLVLMYESLDPQTKAYVYEFEAFQPVVMVTVFGGAGSSSNFYDGFILGFNAYSSGGSGYTDNTTNASCYVYDNFAEATANGGHPWTLPTTWQLGMIAGFATNGSGDVIPIVVVPTILPMPCFLVQLIQTGGSDGSSSSSASYTYTVKNYNGETIMTNAVPIKPRPKGKMTPANAGIAYIAGGGPPIIYWLLEAYETPNLTAYSVVTGVDFGGQTVSTQTILSPT
jgi:hypothetical protein